MIEKVPPSISTESPEAKKQAVFEKAKHTFFDSPWLRFDDLDSDDIKELNLDMTEKYEAIKQLQSGDPNALVEKFDLAIEEAESEVSKIRRNDPETAFMLWGENAVERYSEKVKKLKELRNEIRDAYSLKGYREIGDETQERRRKMILDARDIIIEYGFDQGGGEYCLEALQEMKKGDPIPVIELIKNAVHICRSIAALHLDVGLEGEPPDVEESYARQGEFMSMERFIRAIQKEYAIPIEMTPALRREMRGKKELGILKKKSKKEKPMLE